MACFFPHPALVDGGEVRLYPPVGTSNAQIPCGACIGCKTSRAQEWATRAMHEARSHSESIFATFTYAPEHLPEGGVLVPEHLSSFLKRLRTAMARGKPGIRGKRLRFIAAGEYGDISERPHYHAILFGVGFDDARSVTSKLVSSPTLEKLWKFGTVNYGSLSHASAAYVAGYTMKSHGKVYADADGVAKPAPFMRCSTHPGIGAHYADRFRNDFVHGYCIVDGVKRRIPRYYQKVLSRVAPGCAEASAQASWEATQESYRLSPEARSAERLQAGAEIARRRRELSRRAVI